METESTEDCFDLFGEIDIEDEEGAATKYDSDPWKISYRPKPVLRYIPKEYVDFEQYVKESCNSKIQILNRETFHQITRPIVIFFNHFREKCAYLTEWLDKLYELALRYGDRIEFIAADMYDMDLMYPGRNPIQFFCRLVNPENESPRSYAIDEKKRIHTYYDAYKTVENLSELCDNLLNGSLFPSQPIPENNDSNLIKICVDLNYEELILKSPKNILLIVNLERYQTYEPNYENMALALKDYNLDIVFMEGEMNYVPFEYHAECYPTILFIPFNDKKNFIYYEGRRDEKEVKDFLLNVLEEPEFLRTKQQELKSRLLRTTHKVAKDFTMDFKDLPQFFEENFKTRFQVLDRQLIKNINYYSILIYMDFPNQKCLSHHIDWLDKIYQVVETAYSFKFFVADFKDIDLINTKWKRNDLIKSSEGKPKIYAIGFNKHTYEFGYFDSIPSLFYFTSSLQSQHFYYSQLYPRGNEEKLVKDWNADHFHIFLEKTKKHIFLTFYSSDDENKEKLDDLLLTLAEDVKNLNVEVVKMDVKLNYVDLEYVQETYPVHYFIPKNNKNVNILYRDKDLDRNKIVEFIKSNIPIL